jgi:hypothetical protein
MTTQTETPTPAERERWQRLADEATPGPLLACRLDAASKEEAAKYVAETIALGGDEFYIVLAETPDGARDACHTGNGPTSWANAQFFAAARTAVPALLSALARAEAEREQQNRIALSSDETIEKLKATVRNLIAERDALARSLAEVDGHWSDYESGEFGGEDPEGVAILARAHALVTGKPTCLCGHEKTDHDGGSPEDPDPSLPCELCGCEGFRDAATPSKPRTDTGARHE